MTVLSDQKLPAVFGRYLLVRRLSRGGMGEIFLGKVGEIQGFEKPVVIKKILPDLSRDAEFVQRFIEEAKIAINLSHANIVPVYEVGKVAEQYFLAMQYVEGRDVRTLVARARERGVRVPPDLSLLIVREMANGLAYAHRRTDDAGNLLNLVHCDISPPNLLVSFEGEVKVIDFGIAKSNMQRVQDDESVGFGKFGYMAPEQLVRGGVIDRRTDIYSCGVVLYELLTGQRLFNFPPNVDYRHVAREVTAGRFPRPSERDPRLGNTFDMLVLRALRTAPDERYPTAESLRDAVQQQLYAMNPTISADSLGGFLAQLFPEGVEQDRQMLRAVSQTDLAAYREAMVGASGHTVSFAMGSVYTQQSLASPLPEAPAFVAAAANEGRLTGPVGGKRPSTRQLSNSERVAALAGNTADLVPRSSPLRWAVPVVAALIVIGTAVTITIVAWPDGGGVEVTARDAHAREKLAADAVAVVRVSPASDAGQRVALKQAAPDAALTFPPDPVYGDKRVDAGAADAARRKVVKRPRRHRRRRRRPRKKRVALRPRGVSATQVQRKFRRLKSEYYRFERAYGGRLKGDWQKILFTHTYGKVDDEKYRRLDRMLDELRRKMGTVRRGG